MKYDLVFEGGGAKGMVFAGACQEFFKREHTFDRLLGASAGAITATLLAAGYTPEEMLDALAEKEGDKSVFGGFMGAPPPFTDEDLRAGDTWRLLDGVDFKFIPDSLEKKLDYRLAEMLATSGQFRHALALIERGGWYAADRFVAWLSTKLDSGQWKGAARAFSRMSLSQMFAATGIELSVAASDVTDGMLLVLNHQTAPDCPIVWAVRMSMSIPLVWDEVVWQKGWGHYLGRDMEGHTVVDGGLLSNFPIELFLSDEPQVVKLMGPKTGNRVLGMLIDEQLPVVSASSKGLFVSVNIKPTEFKTVRRLRQLADTATGAHDKMVIDEYSNLVARLPAKGYGVTEFDMSDERRNALVEAGRAAMARYLDAQANPAALSKGPNGKPAGQARTAADRIATSLLFGERDRTSSDLIETETFPARIAPVELSNGEGLSAPSEFNPPTLTKLPMPVPTPLEPVVPPGLPQEIPQEVKDAWTQYMANGFKQNETMFKRTLEAFMKPYRLTIWLYGILFAVGIGLFLTAVVIGLRNGSPVVSVAFAGLSVGAFLAFFLRQPLHALEENLEFITWLGVAFNTYWTRLMYMTDPKTVQADLKAAENDFRESVERLIAQHAELRGKRAGAN